MCYILSTYPSPGGVRKFAVTTEKTVVASHWEDNGQMWKVAVWQRTEGRGYVCCLDGYGKDLSRYIGIGFTAESALLDAWSGYELDQTLMFPPADLITPIRDYDASIVPIPIE